MSYITQTVRPYLDQEIEALAQAIAKNSRDTVEDYSAARTLEYALTKTICRVVKLKFGTVSYRAISVFLGVLESMKLEFYRRVAVPFEDKQKSINGDTYGELIS
jgi:hypothetical protein